MSDGLGKSHRSGLWAWLKELVAPHSHDTSDSMDSAQETSRKGIRALKMSFGALAVTALAQAAIVVLSGSVALLSDTIHNFSDAPVRRRAVDCVLAGANGPKGVEPGGVVLYDR